MFITDADIERAIRRNLGKLDLLPEVLTPFSPDAEDATETLDNMVVD